MSNILDSTSDAEGMDFDLEGALRSLTMDHCPTENQASGSETSTHTTMATRNVNSKGSIDDKSRETYNLIRKDFY